MSMTRKDFQDLAETTAEILNDLTSPIDGFDGIRNLQADRLVMMISDFCARQNPRFDRQRFAQAIAARERKREARIAHNVERNAEGLSDGEISAMLAQHDKNRVA